LIVGDHACLSEDVTCYCVAEIVIGPHVVVSQGSYLCTASHDVSSSVMELTFAPIHIGAQAWVAAQAFVGPGVRIGEGAVVGARAVVTKDLAPWAIAVGNPARVVGQRVLRATAE
jgi:putative colanic acid biosynthesis acetyltransferase WcaF